MKKKLMILGASILQLPAIEKAKELGLEIIVVDMNPNAVGFKVDGIKKEIISTIDVAAIVDAAKRHKIDGIITLATDMPMISVAAVASEMGVIGIDKTTALRATNKVEMRKALQENGVPIPKFYKASNESEYRLVVKNFNVPFIVKPADSSGSRGIFVVQDILDNKLIDEAYEYCHLYTRGGDVIVEEFMSGQEVSVETISMNGECHVIQITDKLTTGEPHYVEMGHSQPTMLDENIVQQIKEVAKSANKAIGIQDGPSHTEIIVTKEGPKIVELGARLGGDNITTHLVPLSTGINMVECCIKIALGEEPDITQKYKKASAIRYFMQHEGVIKEITGIEAAEKIEGVKQISVVHSVGEKITDVIDSGSRIGFVISQADEVQAAVESCNAAIKQIKIQYL